LRIGGSHIDGCATQVTRDSLSAPPVVAYPLAQTRLPDLLASSQRAISDSQSSVPQSPIAQWAKANRQSESEIGNPSIVNLQSAIVNREPAVGYRQFGPAVGNVQLN
jgi:hypothetical protein